MEASNFSALYFKPQPNRNSLFRNAKDAVLLDCRERRNLPGFCTNSGGVFCRRLYACAHRRMNVVSGGNDGVEAKFQPASNDRTSRAVRLGQGSRSRSLVSCQVTKEESGGTMSGESILLNEQTLERELQIAIEEENYAQAAKIRDSLRLLQEDSKASVLAANARFYNSFRNGDLAAMQGLWSKGDHVCVVHPGVSGISGNDLVMGSWEFVWADYEFPLEIEIKDVQVHVRGDVGYVTCIEMVKTKGSSWGRHFASNVFEKVDGQWFICIHHASYVDL
ncbi:Nuclear transport factor 2 family protein [Perilla frutescens var. frutescens]|nr:Nuclear transport factor 2 family protein [Perilla frutescens var. frutescens]